MRPHRLVLIVVTCLAALGMCLEVSGQQASPTPGKVDRIHLGDVVDVDVVGGFEFDWRGSLNPEGYFDSLVGVTEPVFGLCRTEVEIAVEISKSYKSILRDPTVNVRIIDRSNRALVRLDGAVRTPTRFRLQRDISLRELIVLAGGLLDSASGEITIFRPKNLSCRHDLASSSAGVGGSGPQDNGSAALNIKINDLLNGIAAADPQILSGDIITVTRAAPFYVIGAVNNPRPIYSHTEMTVSRAVASAGGPSKDAEVDKVTIFRREGSDTRIINADLDKIKRGEAEDAVLRQFDIVEVAARGGAKRKYPPVVVSDKDKDRFASELPLRVVD